MPKNYSTANSLELLLREVYVHRAVRKSLPHMFIREHEQIRQAARGGNAGSRFEDAVYFFGVAAATGVRKNLTYNALADLMRAIRTKRQSWHGYGCWQPTWT